MAAIDYRNKIIEILGSDHESAVDVALGMKSPDRLFGELRAELEVATSFKKCMEVETKCPWRSDVEQLAHEKVFSLAKTREEYLELYDNIPSGSSVGQEAFSRIIELSSTIEECWEIQSNMPLDYEAERKLNRKVRRLLISALRKVGTLDERRDVLGEYEKVSDESAIAIKILVKALLFTTSIGQCKDIFQHFRNDHTVLAYEAIRRIAWLLERGAE